MEKQKTVRQWLSELPDGYNERAIKNAEEQEPFKHEDTYKLHHEIESMERAIMVAFSWKITKEGDVFWAKVYQHYEQGRPMPAIPLKMGPWAHY